jgi:hypothetical protein
MLDKYLKPSILPVFTLCAGALGLLLRAWLALAATDDKGLLVTTHPAHILVFVLMAIVMAVLFLCIRTLSAVKRYTDLFPNPVLSGIGCLVAAVGILWVNIRDLLLRWDPVTYACLVLGLLAVACLIVIAVSRFKKRRPSCYFHVVVCVYLMVHLVSQYRLWSAEPQLQVYFFPLMASVFLMLTTYHRAVLDACKGSRRWFVFFNQGALFCCCLSVWSESWLFYLAMGFWIYTNLCSLRFPKAAPSEEE